MANNLGRVTVKVHNTELELIAPVNEIENAVASLVSKRDELKPYMRIVGCYPYNGGAIPNEAFETSEDFVSAILQEKDLGLV